MNGEMGWPETACRTRGSAPGCSSARTVRYHFARGRRQGRHQLPRPARRCPARRPGRCPVPLPSADQSALRPARPGSLASRQRPRRPDGAAKRRLATGTVRWRMRARSSRRDDGRNAAAPRGELLADKGDGRAGRLTGEAAIIAIIAGRQ
jgi:hypothetical protein